MCRWRRSIRIQRQRNNDQPKNRILRIIVFMIYLSVPLGLPGIHVLEKTDPSHIVGYTIEAFQVVPHCSFLT